MTSSSHYRNEKVVGLKLKQTLECVKTQIYCNVCVCTCYETTTSVDERDINL